LLVWPRHVRAPHHKKTGRRFDGNARSFSAPGLNYIFGLASAAGLAEALAAGLAEALAAGFVAVEDMAGFAEALAAGDGEAADIVSAMAIEPVAMKVAARNETTSLFMNEKCFLGIRGMSNELGPLTRDRGWMSDHLPFNALAARSS